jgi:hypothetical protein
MPSEYVICTAEGQLGNEGTGLPATTRHDMMSVTFSRTARRGPGAQPYNRKTGRFGWWQSGDGQKNPCKLILRIDVNSTTLLTANDAITKIINAAEIAVAIVFIYAPTAAYASVGGAGVTVAANNLTAAEFRIPILGLSKKAHGLVTNGGNRRSIELEFDAGHDRWNDRHDYLGNWIDL